MVSLMDSGPESIFCAVTNRVAWHIRGQVSWCSGRVSVMITGRGRPLGHMSHEPSTLLRSDESLSHGLWTCSLLSFLMVCPESLILSDFILHADNQLSQDFSLKNICLHWPAVPTSSYIEFLHAVHLLPLSLFCHLGLFVPPFVNTTAA